MTKKRKLSIGVDIGGTSIKFGVVTKEGEIIEKSSLDTFADEGPEKVMEQIKKGIKPHLKKYGKEINGIGIGSPGTVKLKKGIIENPPNFKGWKSEALGKTIKKEFKIDVHVENDANCAAIGEYIFGSATDLKNFIMVTLGTGVGGGIFINKKLYRGETGAAGEIGHITIKHNGRKCNCGSYGCVEAYVGNRYLVEEVKQKLSRNQDSKINELLGGDTSKLTPELIYNALCQGDEFAKSIVIEAGENLGYGLASVINLLDVTNIIIGGGVAGFGKVLFDSVEETVKQRVMKSFTDRITVREAMLKNDAGIKGASALVFYRS